MGEWGSDEKLLPRVPAADDFVNLEIASAVDVEVNSNPFDIALVKIDAGNQ